MFFKYGRILAFTNFFVIWIFLIAFILPTITLAFLVSTCFNKASIAAAVSGLLFLLIYMPYPPMSQFEERIDPWLKIFSVGFSLNLPSYMIFVLVSCIEYCFWPWMHLARQHGRTWRRRTLGEYAYFTSTWKSNQP